MTDVSRSGGVASDGNGVAEHRKAVIVEYAYIKEQLAGPQFRPPAPQITRVEASDGELKIFGKHLQGVRAIHLAGNRVTRPRFQIADGVEPHIEAELPEEAVDGPVTVIATGGVATSQLRLDGTEKPPSKKPPSKA
jgi:hypothetical protein